MKYGESAFDIFYLAFAIVMGLRLLGLKKGPAVRLMGVATLTLGLGDAFHLVPRVLNYFLPGNWAPWLGVGKLVTSLTMTLFYVFLYEVWLDVYGEDEKRPYTLLVTALAAIRAILCLLPQNRWLENGSSTLWGTVRNIPFVLLGAFLVWLWFQKREEVPALRWVWLLVTLSFLFYIPVAVGAEFLPLLGMLMLPKTICYMLLIRAFWQFARVEP